MTTRPEQWSYVQGGGKGLRREDIPALYGKLVAAKDRGKHTPRDKYTISPRLYAVGQEAIFALRAQAISRHGSEALAKKAFPGLWSGVQIWERAVTAPVGEGKTIALMPVAHIGPQGITPLTESQAIASMGGREGQNEAPPPGTGFAAESGAAKAKEAIDGMLDKITGAIKSPAVSAPVSMAGAGLTLYSAYNVLKDPIKGAWEALKEKMS